MAPRVLFVLGEGRKKETTWPTARTAYYQYDGSGQRVRKTIVNTAASITEKRIYVGEWELYTKFVSSSLTTKRESLHVSDDTGRILMIDSPLSPTTGESQLQRYTYTNHLGTSTLELDDAAAIISYEEYYPFGSTSFQSGRSTAEVSLKRYRYTGKERDEETGLYYHGARYYIPWLGRWSASDPKQSEMPTWSSYNYGFCNPITWQDSTGMQPDGNEELIAKVESNNNSGIKKGDVIIDETTGKPELDENGNPLKWQVDQTVITEDRPEWIPEGVTFEGKMEEFYQEMLQVQESHWLGIGADQGLKNYYKEQALFKAENYFNFDLPSQYYQDKFVGFLNRHFNPHGNTYENADFKVSQEAGTMYTSVMGKSNSRDLAKNTSGVVNLDNTIGILPSLVPNVGNFGNFGNAFDNLYNVGQVVTGYISGDIPLVENELEPRSVIYREDGGMTLDMRPGHDTTGMNEIVRKHQDSLFKGYIKVKK